MAADPSKLSYFSLPGEVRNKIMDLVLVHGDVYPCRSVPKTSSDTKANVVSPPGIQLLATCKQAYNEGYELFYSSNTFHLPPTMTFEWSNELQAKHKAMVKRISITLDLEDLNVTTFKQTRERVTANVRGDKSYEYLTAPLARGLYNGWERKMKYIAAWTSLGEIQLRSFNHTNFIQHCNVVTHLEELNAEEFSTEEFSMLYHSLYWRDVLEWPELCVFANFYAQVDRVGWERAIEWLHVRKPGERAEGFGFSAYHAHPAWVED